ncbi:GAF domain-containing protein [Liberiplasma polymorphum]|jgi:L-methionine (R)-S-oxide reductase|uniref:GAF domain-containing protein n=1 Tax=Liberiplasma polymorphum TaxID=3374570 RepID=UPI0037722AB5
MFTKQSLSSNREENYTLLESMLKAFIVKEEKAVTMLSNVSALLNVFMDEINWVGFYLKDDEKLYLGPFQGLPACTEIKIGQGVCGTSAAKKETLIVDDVHAFPGHIACDSASQSEIVVPIVIDNEVYGVIDVDSPVKNRFNALDKRLLEKVATYIVDFLK